MTDEREYRQDDLPDRGWCPACGQPVTTVFVDASGWCPDHGRVWVNWEPPAPVFPAGVVKGYDGLPRVGHMHGPVWVPDDGGASLKRAYEKRADKLWPSVPPAVDPKSGEEHAS